ncbi:protein disulfide isomerase EUG1 NDAI_0F04480 [Naumovozyma dairenensis CBS 421]|uniref:protein disulfide-isomerase n=1 Tax=Naumovozyma dairenensis (strain ATCC 10597 / BCRC 20456 / CBS 421 / NBRC 0211 / NRRL Y-12639) TaxID=1071378 RepID=G0WDA5_NAUDC|nr:hypothetical protein NDAI_0F04480 [Naumovozyma dairenensis CBS 421]CCD25766.1 hypothetical protein NDAI_0F04480 [Naumovozyma dairenensis CBS 421]
MFSKKSILHVFAASLAFMSASANGQSFLPDATVSDDSAVIKLSHKNFTAFIATHDLVLTEFYAPWDYHSKLLVNEYQGAAEGLQSQGYSSDDIAITQLNCNATEDDALLCTQLEVAFYPSLKIFKKHNVLKTPLYQGDRTAESIIPYMIAQSVSPVIVIEKEEGSDEHLQQLLLEATKPVVINFGFDVEMDQDGNITDNSINESFNQTFYNTAAQLSEQYTFISYPSAISSGLVLYPLPEVNVREEPNPENENEMLHIEDKKVRDPHIFSGDQERLVSERDAFTRWLKVSLLPYFADVKAQDFAGYMDTKLPLGYFFYSTQEEFEEYKDFFTELGKKYRGEINFVGLDVATFRGHVNMLGLKEQFPLFAVHNITNNMKYALPQLPDEVFQSLTEPLKLDTLRISHLVEDVANKRAEPISKSDEIPLSQDSNVYKLVGKTHDKFVFDKSKDVLVRYYAPWCAHSKRLTPIYEELADIYFSDNETWDKLLIAEVDATTNDIISYPVEGYPTIVLFPAGEEKNPILFKGPRTLEQLMEFVKNNGTYHIDAKAIQEANLNNDGANANVTEGNVAQENIEEQVQKVVHENVQEQVQVEEVVQEEVHEEVAQDPVQEDVTHDEL